MLYTENYETVLWMHFLDENPGLLSPVEGSSGRMRITNADARRTFCKMWFLSKDFFRWGLIEAGFFDTKIVDFIDDDEALFYDRNVAVDYEHFEHFGLELLYEEVEDMVVRHGSLETGAYPDGLGDDESPIEDMELTEVDGIEDEDFDFGGADFDLDFVAETAPGPDAA